MTKDEFSRRYRMMEQLTRGDIVSHRAGDSDGRPVMLHVFEATDKTPEDVASMLARLTPDDSAKVREILEVEGSVVAVTAEIAPFVTFKAWIAASGRREQAAPPTQPDLASRDQPAAAPADQPGVYTSIFQSLDQPGAPPPLTPLPEPFPASPPAHPTAQTPIDEAPPRAVAPPAPLKFADADPVRQPSPPSAPASPPVPPPVSPPADAPGMYTQIMQVGDLDLRPRQATQPVAEPSPGPSDALRPEPPQSPPVINWRPDALRESPPMPSPPGPAAPRSGLGAGELDTGKGPPPIPDPVIRWQKPAPPAPGNVTPPPPAAPIPTASVPTPSVPAPSMPDAYNLDGGSKDLRPRVPEAEPEASLVKPLENPDAQAEGGNLFKSAPDYVDRLRTQSSPPPSGDPPPVAPPPPPLPDPGTSGPSEYTMVIQGITPSGGLRPTPAPQPPPPAPAPMQPQPVKRPSRVPLVIAVAVVAVVLIGLLVFIALRLGGGAAGTG